MMNSLIDATMSDKFSVNYSRECVIFTIAAHISSDDSDDDDISHVIMNPINIFLPFEHIAKGKEAMLAHMEETIDNTLGQMFFASGVDRFKAVVLTKLRNMDLSKYEKHHFEEPPTPSYH